LNEGFWDKAWKLLPSDWQSEQFHKIKETLNSIVAEKDRFISELKNIMS
jgi:hypothetical protein